jgi:hypothetical protein
MALSAIEALVSDTNIVFLIVPTVPLEVIPFADALEHFMKKEQVLIVVAFKL